MQKCSHQQFKIARSLRLARTQVARRELQDGSGRGGADAPIVVIGSDTIVDVRLGDIGGLRRKALFVFIDNQKHTRVARNKRRLLYVQQ